ncbi:hypothetical protein HDE_13269 [Halotydeus destructor]|nr:hypothetical protein HDE_13269 [Halotydeus destructor]
MKFYLLINLVITALKSIPGDNLCHTYVVKSDTGPDDIYKDGPDTFGMRFGSEFSQRMKLVNSIVSPTQPKTKFDFGAPYYSSHALFTDSRKNYTLYVTNGKTWRTYEPINANVAPEMHPFPKMEQYFKSLGEPMVMAVTQLSNGQYLAFCKMSTLYFGAHVNYQILINHDRSVKSTFPVYQMMPTAVLSVSRVNDTHERLITFYHGIWSYRDYSLKNDVSMSFSSNIDYHSAQDFKGCIPQFGCDGRIDGATTAGPDYHLYRGEYYAQTLVLDSTSYKKSNLPRIDAIDRLETNNSTIIIHENECSVFKTGDEFRLTTCDFNGTKIFETTRVDAIFTIPNTGQLFLIVRSLYYEYIQDDNAQITYVRNGSLSDLWHGLPDNVDAATYLNGNITFFVHNFLFYGDVSRMRTGDSVTGANTVTSNHIS